MKNKNYIVLVVATVIFITIFTLFKLGQENTFLAKKNEYIPINNIGKETPQT